MNNFNPDPYAARIITILKDDTLTYDQKTEKVLEVTKEIDDLARANPLPLTPLSWDAKDRK